MSRRYYAPAKINLWLRVFAADHSGYHPLDTLFCAVDLCDTLAVTAGDELQLHVTGGDAGPTEQNLVLRALREYYLLLGQTPRLRVHLQKNIPAGAGLGGGSSDAAAMLRALQALHGHALPQTDLLALAARLGSDVPFFLCDSPLAQASGRGEVLSALPPLPARAVLLVQPPFTIATRDAYRWLDEEGVCAARAAPLPTPVSWSDVGVAAENTFEQVVFARYPALLRTRDLLLRRGAAIALLSGSGSSLFGVFDDEAAARAAQTALELPPNWEARLVRTIANRTD